MRPLALALFAAVLVAPAGRLEYVPPADGGPSSALIAVVVITGIGAAFGFGLLLLSLRRREEAAAEPAP